MLAAPVIRSVRSIVGGVIVILASVGTGVAVGHGELSVRSCQLAVGVALVTLFWRLDTSAPMIPRILRPGTVMVGGLLVASASITLLTPSEYEDDYLPLWILQVLGFSAAYVVFPRLALFARRPESRAIDKQRLRYLAMAMFAVCLAAAAWYFKSVGIGALSGDLEQSRVNAAEGTSGYFRLIAFLLPVPAALLVATDGIRKAWWATIPAVLFIAGVGSRVPMLYFVLPIVVLLAVTGRRVRSGHIVVAGLAALVFLGWYGAFRIEGTQSLRELPMYKTSVAKNDTFAVARTAVDHYAAIVPSNAVLTKRLVDTGQIPLQWGQTYMTLFTSVLPGKQTSPDMLIRAKSGKNYIGGGTPPTLGGEGYMNFGYVGVFASAAAFMLLLRYWQACVVASWESRDMDRLRVDSLIYGFVVVWGVFANISGIAGSATITLASFLALAGLRFAART